MKSRNRNNTVYVKESDVLTVAVLQNDSYLKVKANLDTFYLYYCLMN